MTNKDKICEISWCNKNQHSRGLCQTHNSQYNRFGKNFRTCNDLPEIIDKGEFYIVKLFKKSGNFIGDLLIDKCDIQIVYDYKIYVQETRHRRCIASKDGKKYSLAKIIMNPGTDLVVDHINHNILDNRRCKLRICTVGENSKNTIISKVRYKTSNYKGVSIKKSCRCRAGITNNGERIHLGMFANEIEAARAYNIAALKYHGEFACLNEMI